MSKYIIAEELFKYLEEVGDCYPRYADLVVDNAVNEVIGGIKTFITSHQQERPSLPSNLDEAADKIVRDWLAYGNGEYKKLVISGARWMAGQGLNAKKEKQPRTCKTCGFYEDNCPFIRGKLIPYPNKVCKGYTYSVVKEVEL